MKFLSIFKDLQIKQNTLLGFYGNHRSVSIVELSRQKKGYHIHHATQFLFPHNNSTKTSSWDTPENLILLQKHLSKEKFLTHQVAITLPYSSVLFKNIALDKGLNDLDIIRHIQEKTRQHIHYPASDLMIDFEILGTSKKHPDLNEIRWVTAKAQEVMPKIKALESIKLKPIIVEVESYTLQRIANFLIKQRYPDDKFVAVIQIYHRYFLFMVLENGLSIYIRTENFSADATELESLILNELQLFLINNTHYPVSLLLVSGLYLSDEIIASLKTTPNISVKRFHLFNEMGDLKYSDESSFELSMAAGLAMRVA